MGKILVVMPCYNVSDTVLEAIQSVMNQTYSDFTLCCCDDKSTDNTLNVLMENQSNFTYKLIKNDVNLGTGKCVNKVIEEQINDDYSFITWVSADNVLEDNFLMEHLKKLNEGYAITYSGWSILGSGGASTPNKDLLHLKNRFMLGPGFMFKKKLFDIAGPYHELPGEDYYFAVNCALNNAKFGYIDDILVRYRAHANSVGGRIATGLIKDLCTHLAQHNAQQITQVNGDKKYD